MKNEVSLFPKSSRILLQCAAKLSLRRLSEYGGPAVEERRRRQLAKMSRLRHLQNCDMQKRLHHWNWDGMCYPITPRCLKTPLLSRDLKLFATCDVQQNAATWIKVQTKTKYAIAGLSSHRIARFVNLVPGRLTFQDSEVQTETEMASEILIIPGFGKLKRCAINSADLVQIYCWISRSMFKRVFENPLLEVSMERDIAFLLRNGTTAFVETSDISDFGERYDVK